MFLDLTQRKLVADDLQRAACGLNRVRLCFQRGFEWGQFALGSAHRGEELLNLLLAQIEIVPGLCGRLIARCPTGMGGLDLGEMSGEGGVAGVSGQPSGDGGVCLGRGLQGGLLAGERSGQAHDILLQSGVLRGGLAQGLSGGGEGFVELGHFVPKHLKRGNAALIGGQCGLGLLRRRFGDLQALGEGRESDLQSAERGLILGVLRSEPIDRCNLGDERGRFFMALELG